jgi:tRNA splicing ligase
MSGKITVTTTPKNRITINNRTGGVGSVDTLVQLKDVDATSLDNNETIVYDEASGKFIIKQLPIINGGAF